MTAPSVPPRLYYLVEYEGQLWRWAATKVVPGIKIVALPPLESKHWSLHRLDHHLTRLESQ